MIFKRMNPGRPTFWKVEKIWECECFNCYFWQARLDILALCRISYNEASSLVQHGSAAYMKPLAQTAAQILLDTSTAGESTPK